MFWRKKRNSGHSSQTEPISATSVSDAEQVRRATLRAGELIFKFAGESLVANGQVKAEDHLAILAYNGGFSCAHFANKITDAQTCPNPEQVDIMVRNFLYQHDPSMLRVAFLSAQMVGAVFSYNDLIDVLEDVNLAASLGEHRKLNIAEQHLPTVSCNASIDNFFLQFCVILERCRVPLDHRPISFGVAIGSALVATKAALNIDVSARIVAQCAVIASRMNPYPVFKADRFV